MRLCEVGVDGQRALALLENFVGGDGGVARIKQVRVAVGDAGVGRGIVVLNVERALEHLLGQPQEAPCVTAVEETAAHQVEAIGLAVVGRALRNGLALLRQHLEAQRVDDGVRDVVLQLEDVLELAVVALGPDMAVGAPVDQLRGDAHPVVHLAHAAFKQILHAQPRGHAVKVLGAALVGEGSVARHHEQRGDLREIGDDVLGDAVAEIILLGVARHVDEGQHRNRGLVFAAAAPLGLVERAARHAPGLGEAGCVLQLALARILEDQRQLAVHLLVHCLGHEDAAGLRNGLQAGGNVDAVAEHVVLLDDHIREVDADAEAHAPVVRQIGVARLGGLLHLGSEAHGIHHAAELGQEAVAQRLDDASTCLGNQRIDDGGLPRHQLGQRARFVALHQPRIARDIGREDCRETPFQVRHSGADGCRRSNYGEHSVLAI